MTDFYARHLNIPASPPPDRSQGAKERLRLARALFTADPTHQSKLEVDHAWRALGGMPTHVVTLGSSITSRSRTLARYRHEEEGRYASGEEGLDDDR